MAGVLVHTVASGGVAVTVRTDGTGMAVEESADGTGLLVSQVASGGRDVRYTAPGADQGGTGLVGRVQIALYDFVGNTGPNGTSTAGLTVARPSAGFDLAATTLFPANTARRTSAGLLVEAAATNVCKQSQALTVAPWGPSAAGGVTVIAGAAAAPDGTLTATRIDLAGQVPGGYAQVTQPTSGLVPGVPYVLSAYLKGASGGEVVYLSVTPDGAIYASAPAVLTTAWKRFSAVFTPTSSGVYYMQVGIDRRDATQTNSASASFFAVGGDCKLGSATTSLIPTTNAITTQAADGISLTLPVGTGRLSLAYDTAATVNLLAAQGAFTLPVNPAGANLTSLRVTT